MKVAKLGLAAALLLGAVLLTASTASAQGVFYYKGPHAVPSEHGGFCNITVKHFHTFKPDDMKVFRNDANTYVFIGDPTAHGFTGPRVSFYGHHPIPAGWGGNWCFISGPHSHFYRPVGTHYNWHGGVYYYTGGYTDPWYIRNRAIYEPVFSTYYATRPGYIRPVIYAPPPRIYVGPRVTVPVVRYTGPTVRVGGPGIRVGGPGIRVGGPAIRVGGPGVTVGGPAVRMGGPVGAPGVRPGMPGPGVRPGMPAPGARPGMPGPGVRPGVAPAPGLRSGVPAPGVRPGAGPGMKGPPMKAPPPMKAAPMRPGPAPIKAAPMRPAPIKAAPMRPAPAPMKSAPRAVPTPKPIGKRR